MAGQVRIIDLPIALDFSHGAEIWTFLRSEAFGKMRTWCEDDLSESEIAYLREEFGKFTSLRDEGDGSYEERYALKEGEELSIIMMKEAVYRLTSLMMKA